MLLSTSAHAGQPSFYLGYFVHLERESVDIFGSQTSYGNFRHNLMDLAIFCEQNGMALDVMPDLPYLWAEQRWGDGQLYAWLQGLDHVEVEPHAHEDVPFSWDGDTYWANTADVAFALHTMGVQDTGIVGGGFAATAWPTYAFGQTGMLYSHHWQPKALHAMGVKGHDSEQLDSGLWYLSSTDYYAQEAAAGLIVIGGQGARQPDMLDYLGQGLLDPAKMNSFGTTINDWMLCSGQAIEMMSREQRVYSQLARAGLMTWATLPGMIDIWQTVYNSQPSMRLYGARQ